MSPFFSSNNNKNRQVAVVFIGNAGAGKSTLLTQIGGNFKSGTAFRKGYTTEKKETLADVNGEEVILMDVPGLFEPNNSATVSNSKKLTNALSQPYDYKLFFVLKASNSGVSNDDLVMMSKVNECLRKADGSPVSFRVIINQVMNNNVWAMYQEHVADDNMRGLFSKVEMEGLSFNINIDNVILLPFEKDGLSKKTLSVRIAHEVTSHQAVQLHLEKELYVENSILKGLSETFEYFKKKVAGISLMSSSGSSSELQYSPSNQAPASRYNPSSVPSSSSSKPPPVSYPHNPYIPSTTYTPTPRLASQPNLNDQPPSMPPKPSAQNNFPSQISNTPTQPIQGVSASYLSNASSAIMNAAASVSSVASSVASSVTSPLLGSFPPPVPSKEVDAKPVYPLDPSIQDQASTNNNDPNKAWGTELVEYDGPRPSKLDGTNQGQSEEVEQLQKSAELGNTVNSTGLSSMDNQISDLKIQNDATGDTTDLKKSTDQSLIDL